MGIGSTDAVSLRISTDTEQTSNNLDKVINRLDKTINLLSKISSSDSFRRKNSDLKETQKVANELNTSLGKINNTLSKIDKNSSWTGFSGFLNIMKKISKESYNWVESSASYVENLNLMQVAFKETGKEFDRANESIVNGLADAFGLDESTMTRQLGYYRQIGNALNIDAKYADTLAHNLLKMQLDMSSLYNLSFEKSGEVLQSSMAGQTKPIRGATGADITQATLQTDLDRLNIDASITDLSRAEKVLLIYLSIQNQIVESQGDLAKTINSTANQQKILAEQSSRLGRAVGDLLNPVFGKLLAVLNGVIMATTELIMLFAKFVGIELPSYDTGTNDIEWAEDLADSLGNSEEKAKNLKKSLRGFDKLNVINTPNKTSGTGGSSLSGAGIMNDLLKNLDEYDIKMSNMANKATEIRDRIMEWLGFTKKINPLTGEIEWEYQGIKTTLKNMWTWFKNLNPIAKLLVGYLAQMFSAKLIGLATKFVGLIGNSGLFKWISKTLTPAKRLFSIMFGSSASMSASVDMWSKTLTNTERLNMTLLGTGGLIVSYGLLKDAMKKVDEQGWNLNTTLETSLGVLGNIGSGTLIGSQFGATGAIIGGVTGALLSLIEAYVQYPTEAEKVTNAVKSVTEQTKEYLDQLDREQQLIQEQLNSELTKTGIYNSYVEELEKIVDANGRVKDGYENRVKFILGELNDAYGTEMSLTNGIISNYDKQIEKIKELIEQQELQYLITANQEAYMKAKDNEVKLYEAKEKALQNLEKAEINAKKTAKDYWEYVQWATEHPLKYSLIEMSKKETAMKEASKAEEEAKKVSDQATKAYKENILIQNRYTELKTAVFSGETEKINKEIEKNRNSYVENGELIQESSDQTTQRQIQNWGILLEEYKKNDNKRYQELINSLAKETKAVEEMTPEQAGKWSILGKTNKEAFINELSKLDSDMQQKVISGMYDHGYSISEELQRGISAKGITLHFNVSTKKVKESINSVIDTVNNSSLKKTLNSLLGIDFNIPKIQFKANGGFPEDGWFRASKGELMGRFDDGTSIVANNRQVVAGVREMLKDGIMDALVMANNAGGSKGTTQVTIVAEDNDLLNGIKFKEKQRDRQFGY